MVQKRQEVNDKSEKRLVQIFSCILYLSMVLLFVRLEVILMAKVPEIIPVSDLRQDAAAVLKRVRDSHEPLIVTQRGRAAAVMLSIKSYEQVDRERQILRQLLRGEREIAAGDGFDFESVLAEVDSLLSGGES
jgi:prevent-host-death family protein